MDQLQVQEALAELAKQVAHVSGILVEIDFRQTAANDC